MKEMYTNACDSEQVKLGGQFMIIDAFDLG